MNYSADEDAFPSYPAQYRSEPSLRALPQTVNPAVVNPPPPQQLQREQSSSQFTAFNRLHYHQMSSSRKNEGDEEPVKAEDKLLEWSLPPVQSVSPQQSCGTQQLTSQSLPSPSIYNQADGAPYQFRERTRSTTSQSYLEHSSESFTPDNDCSPADSSGPQTASSFPVRHKKRVGRNTSRRLVSKNGSGQGGRFRATDEQTRILLEYFDENDKPGKDKRDEIAKQLTKLAINETSKMTSRHVQVWFQNRRAYVKNPPKPKNSTPTRNKSVYESYSGGSGDSDHEKSRRSRSEPSSSKVDVDVNEEKQLMAETVHAKSPIITIPVQRLTIGQWTRLAESTQPGDALVIYFSPNDETLVHYLTHASTSYKMVTKMSHLEGLEVVSHPTVKRWVCKVAVARPPRCYVGKINRDENTDEETFKWSSCGDFTSGNISRHLVHNIVLEEEPLLLLLRTLSANSKLFELVNPLLNAISDQISSTQALSVLQLAPKLDDNVISDTPVSTTRSHVPPPILNPSSATTTDGRSYTIDGFSYSPELSPASLRRPTTSSSYYGSLTSLPSWSPSHEGSALSVPRSVSLGNINNYSQHQQENIYPAQASYPLYPAPTHAHDSYPGYFESDCNGGRTVYNNYIPQGQLENGGGSGPYSPDSFHNQPLSYPFSSYVLPQQYQNLPPQHQYQYRWHSPADSTPSLYDQQQRERHASTGSSISSRPYTSMSGRSSGRRFDSFSSTKSAIEKLDLDVEVAGGFVEDEGNITIQPLA